MTAAVIFKHLRGRESFHPFARKKSAAHLERWAVRVSGVLSGFFRAHRTTISSGGPFLSFSSFALMPTGITP